jgi:hypothetical protein
MSEEKLVTGATSGDKSDEGESHDDEERGSEITELVASSAAAVGETCSSIGGTQVGVGTTKRKALDRSNLSEKKLRRLEKNRMSARECRRRKKEAAQQMEQEIRLIEKENLSLRLQLKIGEEGELSSIQEAEKLTEAIEASLKSGASDSTIYANIEEIKEKFADYGRDRRSAMQFHLRNVERLLMPTRTTSVAMKALEVGHPSHLQSTGSSRQHITSNRGSETAVAAPVTTAGSSGTTTPALATNSSSKTNKQIFEFLVQYLEVTPTQADALKDSRKVAQELDSALAQSFSMFSELEQRLTQMLIDLETEFNSVRAILTPTQVAKFVVWISRNGACMHMLNELWGKIYQR